VNASVGDLLIFCVRFNGTTPGTITVNDTLGNTYSLVPGWPVTLNSEGWMYMYYAISGSAGACTASFAYTGTTEECDMVTAIYTGMSATPFDKTANATGTGTSTDSGATATTSNANEVLIGLATDSSGLCTFTAGTNLAYTLRIQQNTVFSLEDVNVASTGQYHATGNMSPSTTWQQAIVTFMAAATSFSISGNAGVAGANVAYSGTAAGNVTADGSGNYTIPNLANGSYTITPSLAGYTFSPISQNETLSGSNITGVNFTATPTTSSISGNAGVAGANVAYSGAASGNVTADGSGNYTISGLANGAYTITPSFTGYTFSPTSRNETVSGSNITGVNFIATPQTSFSVTDSRVSPFGPNNAINVNGTETYTQTPNCSLRWWFDTSFNHTQCLPEDCRAAGAPVASGTYPQNSRVKGG
jgi:hypothetical protein